LGSPPLQGAPEHDPLQPPEVTRVLEGLSRFPLRQQDVIALKFDAELTNAQIAQVMGLSEGNVRQILYRTLQKLRKALEREP
jgi:RNA polymerase sigma factor (sigma-70 family)